MDPKSDMPDNHLSGVDWLLVSETGFRRADPGAFLDGKKNTLQRGAQRGTIVLTMYKEVKA